MTKLVQLGRHGAPGATCGLQAGKAPTMVSRASDARAKTVGNLLLLPRGAVPDARPRGFEAHGAGARQHRARLLARDRGLVDAARRTARAARRARQPAVRAFGSRAVRGEGRISSACEKNHDGPPASDAERHPNATYRTGARSSLIREQRVEAHAERLREAGRHVDGRRREAELDTRQVFVGDARGFGELTLREPSLFARGFDGSAEGPAKRSFPHAAEARRKSSERKLPIGSRVYRMPVGNRSSGRRANAFEIDTDRSAPRRFARHLHEAADALNDLTDGRQANARALARPLRR